MLLAYMLCHCVSPHVYCIHFSDFFFIPKKYIHKYIYDIYI